MKRATTTSIAVRNDRGVVYVQSAGVEVKEDVLAHALSVALRLAYR